MSWLNQLASFTKRLLMLEGRVENNAEEVKALRQDLNALTDFTKKIAYAVKRNEERTEDKHENLILNLKVELLELEKRLSAPHQNQKSLIQFRTLDDGKEAIRFMESSD